MIKFTESTLLLSPIVAKALLAFASTDATRPHLGIGICNGGDVAATDGVTLVRFTMVDPGQAPKKHDGQVWAHAYVKEAARIAGSKKDVVLLWSDCQSKSFPPVLQVEPQPGFAEKMAPIGVDAEYLARLAIVQKACGRGEVIVDTLGSPLDPLAFTVNGVEHGARVTIMPRRI